MQQFNSSVIIRSWLSRRTVSWLGVCTVVVIGSWVPESSVVAGYQVGFIPAAGRSIVARHTASFLAATTTLRMSNGPNYNLWPSWVGTLMNKNSRGMSSSTTSLSAVATAVDQALSQQVPTLASWEQIRTQLEASMTSDDERHFRANLAQGLGVGSPLHLTRLYELPRDGSVPPPIRVTFYRDAASWCPYCQKVWLALEQKRIPYSIEKINMSCYGDKPGSFLRLQPSGQIPVARIDQRVYGQSNDILYALEELFPDHPSLSPPPGQEGRAQELLRLERQIFSTWLSWLTGRSMSQAARQAFLDSLQQVEQALANQKGPFFLGAQVSLVDFMFAPFLERMCASLLYFKGFQMRWTPGTKNNPYPALNRWFDAMETLPSYQLTKSDYYTHCWDLPPQLGGCTAEPAGEPYRKVINGEQALDGSRGSWEFPLEPHQGGVEPDWAWAAADDAAARREAVERVSANQAAIVSFATRGAGRPGFPPVAAPLADPRAVPNETVKNAVSCVMQTICQAMLQQVGPVPTAAMDQQMDQIANILVKSAGNHEFSTQVVDSLAYVRDRVGVPRDMKLPAARQLRAYLNWSIGKILAAQSSA